MKHFLIILLINIAYSITVIVLPSSQIYKIDESNLIQHYSENISADTDSYYNLKKDGLRTIGYPFILRQFTKLNNWHIWIFMFNSFLGAWMFFVVKDMIGRKAWLLAALGAFTVYVPILYSDLLFAALFVTSIWMIKKRLWLHFVLLGVASLVRPSLAWFFLIEPLIIYYNGYRKWIVYLSLPIVFIVTSFNPIRNYINIGKWTHSTVLKYNISSGDYYDGPLYFIEAFKANCLSGHYDFIGSMFGKYKRNFGNKTKSNLLYYLNYVCVLINLIIWFRFGIRFLQRKINMANILVVAYFIGPSLFAAAGGRIRLPIEWILLL